MSRLTRNIVAIALGLLAWAIVATLVNFVLRAVIPGYHAQEVAISYTLVAQVSRLALGVIATAAAAAVTVVMSRGSIGAALAMGCLLLALFVPVHITLWHRFPVWYHLFFLASLPFGAYVFGSVVANRGSAVRPAA